MLQFTWREALAALVLVVGLGGLWAGASAQETPAVDAEERPATVDELRAERNRLWDEARRLRDEGKLADAAAAAERMVAIERQWLGEDDDEIVFSLEWLANIYEQAKDWPSAVARRREALAWREAHQEAGHQETVDARLALLRAERDRLWEEAQRLRDEGKLAEAAAAGERMLAVERQWLEEGHDDIIVSLEWLARVYEQAEELAFLPLGGVELVVMSACETGLGTAEGGQGLLGIQRAFQVSGARTTVASLWKVEDAWTERLMTLFYRNALEKKQPYLEALRNAQLEILQQLRGDGAGRAEEFRGANEPADAVRGAPYYWAAFTLSGDWR